MVGHRWAGWWRRLRGNLVVEQRTWGTEGYLRELQRTRTLQQHIDGLNDFVHVGLFPRMPERIPESPRP